MSGLDPIDERIVRTLRSNGRLTNAELGARVGLSASSCSRRVAELERTGVIRGYRASLDPHAMGRGFVAYITVGLSLHTKEAQESFERAMARAEQVTACHNVTGPIEYLLRVEVSDIAAYKAFHTHVLGATPHVASIQSFIVLGSTKDELD